VAVYTFHLWPKLGPAEAGPVGQAGHYTGTAKEPRLRARWVDHAMGRGAKMLKAHVERGGTWVVAKVEPGGPVRERQLKKQGGASRRCGICKAEKDLAAGKITPEEALARSGWNAANPAERMTLRQIFGIEAEPQDVPQAPPVVLTPRPKPAGITAEVSDLADQLIAGWLAEKSAAPEGELSSASQEAEREMEMEAG